MAHPLRRRPLPNIARVAVVIFLAGVAAVSLPYLPMPSAAAAPPRSALVVAGAASAPGLSHLGPFALANGSSVSVAELLPYLIHEQEWLRRAANASSDLGDSTSRTGAAPSGTPATPSPEPSPSQHSPLLSSTGTVSGVVVDSVSGQAVGGAAATVYAGPSFTCTSGCWSGTTDSGGHFAVTAAPGISLLSITAAHYLENDSVVTVPNGSSLDVGSIALIHDGYVRGLVVGSDPGHEPVPGISVSAQSRDQLLSGSSTVTTANGSFFVEVPPVASILSFSVQNPHGPYLPNESFVDVGPNRTLDVGNVELPRGTAIHVTLVDQTTGAPISPLPTPWMDLAACVQDSNSCPFDGAHDNDTVWSLPGPTYLRVSVLGYLENTSAIGVVPSGRARTTMNVTVHLTPDAIVSFRTGLTGGAPPPEVANSTIGEVESCSLSSLTFVYMGTPVTNNSIFVNSAPCDLHHQLYSDFQGGQTVLVPPLRTEFDVLGHEAANGTNAFLPLFSNTTWINATPGRVLDVGTLNLTPGGWVSGRVLVQGTGQPPAAGFSVQACSTDELGWCTPGQIAQGSCSNSSDPAGFCVGTPPGPVRLDVTSQGAIGNRTWVQVPEYCCNHLGPETAGIDLRNVSAGHIQEINVSSYGSGNISGRVLEHLPGGGFRAPAQALVQLCPVSPLAPPGPCPFVYPDSSGNFAASALLGWLRIAVSAAGDAPNSTWVDVTGHNSTGTIWLDPDAAFIGEAVTPGGAAVPGTTATICPVSLPYDCAPVGSGVGLPGGAFDGQIAVGSFPGNAYRVDLTAIGYSEGSSWANLTAGRLSDLGQIVLIPTGNQTAGRPLTARFPGVVNAGSSWVDGSVDDARTHQPLTGYFVEACPVQNASACQTFPNSPTVFGGEFNGSVVTGGTWITVTEPGFYSNRTFVNLTGAPMHLGRILLEPFPRVGGRIAYAPWASLTFAGELAPEGSVVQVCDLAANVCGLGGFPRTDGFFDISAPAGSAESFRVTPANLSTPDGTPGAGLAGYAQTISVPLNGTTLPESPSGAPELALYGSVSGHVGDSTTRSSGGAARLPVRYGIVTAEGSSSSFFAGENLTGGGQYRFFVPPGLPFRITASGAAYWRASLATVAPTTPVNRSVAFLELPHYGWVNVRVREASDGAGIPFAGVTTSFYDVTNNTNITTSGAADLSGFANVTAPPGDTVRVTAAPAGYTPVSSVASVSPSRTTLVTLQTLNGSGGGTWVSSWEVNTVGVPLRITVQDPVAGVALSGASTFVANDIGQPVTPGIYTNGLGQFLVAALTVANESFAVEKAGYATNATLLPSLGTVFRYRTINMTGDGVVSGRLVDGYGRAPIEGAQVSACATTFPYLCRTVISNASGGWWIGVPPGITTISFVANDFVANQSLSLRVCSDCFLNTGTTPLWNDAIVTGSVVAAPSYHPVGYANVSLCPLNVVFYAYCITPVATDPRGAFEMAVTAGTYYLNVTDRGFAPISIEIGLSAGELVNVGELVLEPNGTIAGDVLSGANNTPISGASVSACPASSGFACTTSTTSGAGRYSLVVAPGTYTVSASASGYLPESESVNVSAAALTVAATLYLPFFGPGQLFPVAGEVRSDSITGVPLASAFVAAERGGSPVGSATTNATGAFRFDLPWGSYELSVSAAGYTRNASPLLVHGPQIGLTIALRPFAWPVRGSVSIAESGAPAPGSTVTSNGAAVATAGATGDFSFTATNGTYNLTVAPTGPIGRDVSSIEYELSVRGPPSPLLFVLPLITFPATLEAVDAKSGAAIPGAQLVITGVLGVSLPYRRALQTDSSGIEVLQLPVGSYRVNASASGFLQSNTTFVVSNLPIQATVLLAEGKSPGVSAGPPVLLYAAAAAGGAALLGGVWAVLRGRNHRLRRLEGEPEERVASAPNVPSEYPSEEGEYTSTEPPT